MCRGFFPQKKTKNTNNNKKLLVNLLEIKEIRQVVLQRHNKIISVICLPLHTLPLDALASAKVLK